LGYNNSMGRTADGGGIWAPCTTATYNLPNNCPPPSPTTTPIPTEAPMPTTTPLPTQPQMTPTSILKQQMVVSPLSSTEIPANENITYISPTPVPDESDMVFKINKTHAVLVLFVVTAWAIIAVVAYARHKKKHVV
jgi:hypothetical protein